MFGKIRKYLITAALCAPLALGGCMTGNEGAGTLIGGLAGGAVGSQFGKGTGRLIATGAGALFGGLVGHTIGGALDTASKQKANRATNTALNTGPGQPIAWENPGNSGAHGHTVVTRQGHSGGQLCREFYQIITVGGKEEDGYGIACRQPDGSWKIRG